MVVWALGFHKCSFFSAGCFEGRPLALAINFDISRVGLLGCSTRDVSSILKFFECFELQHTFWSSCAQHLKSTRRFSFDLINKFVQRSSQLVAGFKSREMVIFWIFFLQGNGLNFQIFSGKILIFRINIFFKRNLLYEIIFYRNLLITV